MSKGQSKGDPTFISQTLTHTLLLSSPKTGTNEDRRPQLSYQWEARAESGDLAWLGSWRQQQL